MFVLNWFKLGIQIYMESEQQLDYTCLILVVGCGVEGGELIWLFFWLTLGGVDVVCFACLFGLVVFLSYFCVFYLPCFWLITRITRNITWWIFLCLLVVGSGGVGGINWKIFVWLACIFFLFFCIFFALFLPCFWLITRHHPCECYCEMAGNTDSTMWFIHGLHLSHTGGGMRGGGREFNLFIFLFELWPVVDVYCYPNQPGTLT